MKAITQDTHGSTDVLEFRDLNDPSIGENDVLIRVKAAGVDVGTWPVITYLLRIMGFGLVEGRGRGKVAITI